MSRKPAGRKAVPHTLTHLDEAGNVAMVDVSRKDDTRRQAMARGFVRMLPSTVRQIDSGATAKGNVLAVARVAGIMAAKHCSDLVPLAHPLPLTDIKVDLTLGEDRVDIEATVGTVGKTGVEMEALAAVSIAALTIYDMCKAVDRSMIIESVRVVQKSGGKTVLHEDPIGTR